MSLEVFFGSEFIQGRNHAYRECVQLLHELADDIEKNTPREKNMDETKIIQQAEMLRHTANHIQSRIHKLED